MIRAAFIVAFVVAFCGCDDPQPTTDHAHEAELEALRTAQGVLTSRLDLLEEDHALGHLGWFGLVQGLRSDLNATREFLGYTGGFGPTTPPTFDLTEMSNSAELFDLWTDCALTDPGCGFGVDCLQYCMSEALYEMDAGADR